MKRFICKETDSPSPEDEPSFRELMEQADARGNQRRPPPPVRTPAPHLERRRTASSLITDARESEDEFMRTGLQHREMRQLKKGKFRIGDNQQIDLHGLKRDDAHRALVDFLEHCLRRGARHAVVICGKGYHSPHRKPVLKSLIRRWLMDCNKVLAYCPALQKDGGTGALYVLLSSSRHSNSPDYD